MSGIMFLELALLGIVAIAGAVIFGQLLTLVGSSR
jgi:hypothetical protein